jgi:hypothetical protein
VLEATAGATWAQVVATELFLEEFVAVDDAQPALDLRLGRKPLTPLARALVERGLRRDASCRVS